MGFVVVVVVVVGTSSVSADVVAIANFPIDWNNKSRTLFLRNDNDPPLGRRLARCASISISVVVVVLVVAVV